MSTGNVIGGHNATISNPKTSQAAKEHSRRVIQELEGQSADDDYPSGQSRVDVDVDDDDDEAIIETNPSNVHGDSAYHESVLGDTGPAVDDDPFAGKEPNRVFGGYKATLHNPNTSEEAKARAKAELEQHGVAIE
ncbi:hypothetical protein BDM02DRAFT_2367788 [Thelephora ganbajun]|uniref:Uncharacterized protein n=1 Tax=Thelephora ganbajun TaxID=370292 RepID=A0ACB6ZTY9_THEGA|nr:hypothetical protein BDM02DRAFT_2367788 [Thelephora ganbajun]